jgi:hypothetical protein
MGTTALPRRENTLYYFIVLLTGSSSMETYRVFYQIQICRATPGLRCTREQIAGARQFCAAET